MAISAFPLLTRVLVSRRLHLTTVGQTALVSAAKDDAIAICMLLVVVAIYNGNSEYSIYNNSAINAVYILLSIVAFTTVLFVVVKPFLRHLVLSARSSDGYNQFNNFVVLLVLFVSAFFTQSIGLDGFIGAFLVGLITPHERGFSVAVEEKLNDMISIVLLPVYFANSGLQIEIGRFKNLFSWVVVIIAILVSYAGKMLGSFIGAKLSGFSNREGVLIGICLSTKGLVELIVLNIGIAVIVAYFRVV